MWTFERSASAAMSRGTMVSAAPSSAHRTMTLRFGVEPSSQGHCPPLLTFAPTLFANVLLPKPGSPPIRVVFPLARRPAQNQPTASGVMSEARCTTSCLLLCETSVGPLPRLYSDLPPLSMVFAGFG